MRRDRIALVDDDGTAPLRSFERLRAYLGPRAAHLRFAMNAGMYDENGRPIGLYVEAGKQRHALSRASGGGNFGLKPNGVFAVGADGRVDIATTENWSARPRPARWATQSGPMLVIGGRLHPLFQANGPSLNIRNGVGVDGAGTAWFAISDDPVSFGRFARLFRDSLGCRDALYFDGAVSSLWDPAAGRQDRRAELGPMILVLDRG
jgi:uncharacterized protein YigE (DUF2233 family)